MQLGSLLRSGRRRGPDIWEFRYRDRRHNGRRIYRRINIGTVQQFKTEALARKGIAGLVREINFGEIRFKTTTMTVAELVEHYRQRELIQDNTWKSYSTKCGYESYLTPYCSATSREPLPIMGSVRLMNRCSDQQRQLPLKSSSRWWRSLTSEIMR
jgi:hypothetical protein